MHLLQYEIEKGFGGRLAAVSHIRRKPFGEHAPLYVCRVDLPRRMRMDVRRIWVQY
jgi:hypothetical protein